MDVLKVVQLDWANDLLGKPCDPLRMGQSYAWCVLNPDPNPDPNPERP